MTGRLERADADHNSFVVMAKARLICTSRWYINDVSNDWLSNNWLEDVKADGNHVYQVEEEVKTNLQAEIQASRLNRLTMGCGCS